MTDTRLQSASALAVVPVKEKSQMLWRVRIEKTSGGQWKLRITSSHIQGAAAAPSATATSWHPSVVARFYVTSGMIVNVQRGGQPARVAAKVLAPPRDNVGMWMCGDVETGGQTWSEEIHYSAIQPRAPSLKVAAVVSSSPSSGKPGKSAPSPSTVLSQQRVAKNSKYLPLPADMTVRLSSIAGSRTKYSPAAHTLPLANAGTAAKKPAAAAAAAAAQKATVDKGSGAATKPADDTGGPWRLKISAVETASEWSLRIVARGSGSGSEKSASERLAALLSEMTKCETKLLRLEEAAVGAQAATPALGTAADAAAAQGGFFPMAMQWTRYGAIAGAVGLPIAAR